MERTECPRQYAEAARQRKWDIWTKSMWPQLSRSSGGTRDLNVRRRVLDCRSEGWWHHLWSLRYLLHDGHVCIRTRGRPFNLLFAVGCLLSSVYGYLAGAWPFRVVEFIWSGIALRRWHAASRTGETRATLRHHGYPRCACLRLPAGAEVDR